MTRYRRNYVPGGTFFFTVVTERRRPILIDDGARRLLCEAIEKVRAKRPFDVIAWSLMPDHAHCVWSLPTGDADYSTRWQQIKEDFTRAYLRSGGAEAATSTSRRERRERGVWQRRFWEHTCRDETDLKRCVDYVHWNPKKHRLVERVCDWPWSTFHRHVSEGEYTAEWGSDDPTPGYDDPEWGEI